MFSIASSHWMFLLVATVFKKKKKKYWPFFSIWLVVVDYLDELFD